MSFSLHVGHSPRPHCHQHHHRNHHHHGFGFGPRFFDFRPRFYEPPTVHFTTPVTHVHVTPLSETGRKFVNLGAASIATGVIMSVVGACLAPVSFGASIGLCGVGAAFIIGGIASSIYGHVRGQQPEPENTGEREHLAKASISTN